MPFDSSSRDVTTKAHLTEITELSGAITTELDGIIDGPLHHRVKVSILTALAEGLSNQAQLSASWTPLPAPPVAINAAAAAPIPTSPNNSADLKRIAELEGWLNDVASALGVSLLVTSGKIDGSRLAADAKAAATKTGAAAAAPTDSVPKAAVLTAVKAAKAVAGRLESPRGKNVVIGKDALLNELDKIEKIVK